MRTIHPRRNVAAATAAICLWITTGTAIGQNVVRIEEEWTLSVGQPSIHANGPQVSTVMSPYPDTNDQYFMFYINHRTYPAYEAGGAQVQLLYGDSVDASSDNPNDSLLDQDEEELRWTQIMSITASGQLQFEIKNGTSKSWGGFGGLGHLKLTTSTNITNLNGYRPQVSLGESGIGFAGNRVVSLVLHSITWVTEDGKVYKLNAPFDIDSDIDPWD